MDKDTAKSIQLTKEQFEKSFSQGTLYDRQTQDKAHLQRILNALPVKGHDTILDLGTGSGYLAFAMAKRFPESNIIGLDIVEQTLEENRKRTMQEGLDNLQFLCYDGVHFPLESASIDCMTARYCLHHFPEIQSTFYEVSRVLKQNGQFLIADPTPNEGDEERFVDDYMRMKNDGHIKYYTKDEFTTLAQAAGMRFVDAFQTEICFPRLKSTAYGFEEIMKHHNPEVIAGYQVKVTDDQQYIYITQKVWNLVFEKCS